MTTTTPAAETITLPSSAVFYLAIRKVGRFFFFCVLILFYSCIRLHAHPSQLSPQAAAWTPGMGIVMGIIVFFGLFLIALGYCYLLVGSYKIQMKPDGVSLHYGVINTSNELLLFAKIQDIVINRNILQRMMGLSTLAIQNAMGKPEIIPALGEATAEQLREQIVSHLRKAN